MSIALILATALAQSAAGASIDLTIPPGANFDKAEFRLWYPPSTATVQATLVLVPGSNGDGRPMADDRAPPCHRRLPLHRQAARSNLHRTVRQRRAVNGSSLKPLDPKSGCVADLKAQTFRPSADAPPQTEGTAWLPTLTVAKVWQAVVTANRFRSKANFSAEP